MPFSVNGFSYQQPPNGIYLAVDVPTVGLSKNLTFLRMTENEAEKIIAERKMEAILHIAKCQSAS